MIIYHSGYIRMKRSSPRSLRRIVLTKHSRLTVSGLQVIDHHLPDILFYPYPLQDFMVWRIVEDAPVFLPDRYLFA